MGFPGRLRAMVLIMGVSLMAGWQGTSPDPLWGASRPAVLEKAGEYVTFCRELLQPQQARASFQRLLNMGKDALPTVQEMLRGKNLRLVRAALDLCETNEFVDEMAQDLFRVLRNRKLGGLRVRAARLLGKLGGPLETCIPSLVGILKDSNIQVRTAVAETLLELVSKKENLWPELWKQVRSPDSSLRKLMVTALAQGGRYAHPLLPVAVKYLQQGRVEPADLLAAVVPRFLPGAEEFVKATISQGIQELALGDGIAPDAEAIDLADAEAEEGAADMADAAASFEDIPAGE
jgi:HEAT repeat protein